MPNRGQNFDWMRAASALYGRFGQASLEPAVLKHLQNGENRPVLAACSGGADSVSMLCLLCVLSRELGFSLHVAHYNHRWRGADSAEDAVFVSSLAEGLDLPFHLAERPDNEAAFTETTARVLRLEFLRDVARTEDCSYIAFGHNLDDILETQLQRLARGSGSEGLAAPRPVATFDQQPTHLRPLLALRSGDIRMAMHSLSIPWREDASNHDSAIARNALRHEVIPSMIEALDRDPANGAARSRRLLEEDAAALDLISRARLPAAFSAENHLARNLFHEQPVALVRRALIAWLSGHGLSGSLSGPAVDLLVDAVRADGGTVRYSAGAYFVCMNKDSIWIEEGEDDEPLGRAQFEPGESVMLTNGGTLESKIIDLDEKTRCAVLAGKSDPAVEAILIVPDGEPFEVRGWHSGDRFRPLGAPGTKKLKDWFIDRQIPRRERKQIPLVLTSSGEVIWVPGFPPADRLKILANSKRALKLTYRPGNPR
jgi:tRNA(Ile)-lysidine synthase